MARILYSLLWYLGTPLIAGYLLFRSIKQPEYRKHWRQRWGFNYPDLGHAPVIWCHAVSVGETRAAAELIRRLLKDYPDYVVLLTHGTPTGRATGEEIFAKEPRVKSCYLPYDYPGGGIRFLRHSKPRIGLIMETEIWPNLFASASHLSERWIKQRGHGLPLVLVNGRLSEKSLLKAVKRMDLFKPALAKLGLILVQTEAHRTRFKQLGLEAKVLGNLKFDQGLDLPKQAQGHAWAQALGKDVLVLASSREGEEKLLLDALKENSLGERYQVLIVPRHPQRLDQVEAEIRAAGFEVLRRSASAWPGKGEPNTILLGDSMGEMASYYSMSSLCLMGGTFGGTGGQNHIEACAYACPVILGPSTFNFEEAAKDAIQVKAAIRVELIEDGLQLALSKNTLPSPEAALAFAQQHRGALERTLGALRVFL